MSISIEQAIQTISFLGAIIGFVVRSETNHKKLLFQNNLILKQLEKLNGRVSEVEGEQMEHIKEYHSKK